MLSSSGLFTLLQPVQIPNPLSWREVLKESYLFDSGGRSTTSTDADAVPERSNESEAPRICCCLYSFLEQRSSNAHRSLVLDESLGCAE